MPNTSTDDFFPEDDTPTPTYAPSPGTSGGSPADGDVFVIPSIPVPAGLLRAYVKDVKRRPNVDTTLIIEVQPDEGQFANTEHVAVWFDLTKSADVARFKAWAGVLGVTIPSNGAVPRAAFLNKPCRAMFVPWHKDDGTVQPQIGKFPPSPDPTNRYHSADFHKWATANAFNYDTLKGTSGIMPLT